MMQNEYLTLAEKYLDKSGWSDAPTPGLGFALETETPKRAQVYALLAIVQGLDSLKQAVDELRAEIAKGQLG